MRQQTRVTNGHSDRQEQVASGTLSGAWHSRPEEHDAHPANVLIRSEGVDRISCAATDLKVTMVVTLPAKVEQEGGVTGGARQAFEIAKGLSGEEVHLHRTEHNWLEMQMAARNSRLVGMSERDYPKLPAVADAELCQVDPAILSEMIRQDSLFHLAR